MNKILSPKQAIEISKEQKALGKRIVVAGGCFDVLHAGHVLFLQKARQEGDILFVLLESDASVTKSKGKGRPINKQEDRAIVLSGLSSVGYVVNLELMTKDSEYDKLIVQLKPDIIAATLKDPNSVHKERQAKKIGGEVRYVTKRIGNFSTRRVAGFLK